MKITLSEIRQLVRQELRNANTSSRSSRRRLSESNEEIVQNALAKCGIDSMRFIEEDEGFYTWEEAKKCLNNLGPLRSQISFDEKTTTLDELSEMIRNLHNNL